MVTGGDSCERGHGFKFQHQILDGDFFTLICCKNCIVCLNRPKINKNWPRSGPFIKNIFGSGMNLNFLDHFFN